MVYTVYAPASFAAEGKCPCGLCESTSLLSTSASPAPCLVVVFDSRIRAPDRGSPWRSGRDRKPSSQRVVDATFGSGYGPRGRTRLMCPLSSVFHRDGPRGCTRRILQPATGAAAPWPQIAAATGSPPAACLSSASWSVRQKIARSTGAALRLPPILKHSGQEISITCMSTLTSGYYGCNVLVKGDRGLPARLLNTGAVYRGGVGGGSGGETD